MRDLDDAALERRLREVLNEHLGTLPLDLTVEGLDRRREARGVPRRFGRGRGMTLLAAAALLLVGGALAAGSGVLRRPAVVPPAPSRGPLAVAAPDATPSPSKLAKAGPSPTAVPIAWTTASLKEDWPGPVRTEPAGPPILVPLTKRGIQVADPTGDTGSDTVPWSDINNVGTGCCGGGVVIDLVSGPKPADDGPWGITGSPWGVDPRQVWFAYGLVVDTDGDGVADYRYGIDNVPVGTPGPGGDCPVKGPDPATRYWRTDLHTGRTDWNVCDSLVGPAPDGIMPADPASRIFIFRSWPGMSSVTAHIAFGAGDTPAGDSHALVPGHFYAWASLIQDGRVVATDYAPDAGWLIQKPNAKP